MAPHRPDFAVGGSLALFARLALPFTQIGFIRQRYTYYDGP